MCHGIVLWICVLDQGSGKMSNRVMVMWFLWRPLWPASHHLKRNENFQRKTTSGTQVPLGLVGGEVVALGLAVSGRSPVSCCSCGGDCRLGLSLDVSACACATSRWGCSVPCHAPLGRDSNSTMKVGEDGDGVGRLCSGARGYDKELSLQEPGVLQRKGVLASSEMYNQ